MQLVSDAGTLLVLDCGTGARNLGDHLLELLPAGMHGHIFLTHTHWDHIQGFPFFAPVFAQGNVWTVYGPRDGERQLEQALSGQMQYTYFPVELNQISAGIDCVDLEEGQFQLTDLEVSSQYLNHPAVTLGYRFQTGGVSFAYVTDHEPFSPVLFRRDDQAVTLDSIVHAGDRRHADFIAGVDLLIHDAQYTSVEYDAKRNWGHSSIDYVVDIAMVAGVRRLALFHHDPAHDDEALDRIERHARSRVSKHGGHLDVFCAREGQTIALAEPARTGLPVDWAPGPARPRILIADDEPMIRELVREILKPDNFRIDLAASGEEALRQVGNSRPDLVLLDMRLPDIDGFEVLERIRGTDSGRDLPVIMLTALSDADFIERGFQLGATDHMTKPFSPAQLRARVTGWLRRTAHEGVVPG